MSPSPESEANHSAERSPARLAVFVSGNGSNLQAVIDACQAGVLPAEVAVVVSNNPEAYALHRAASADIPTMVVDRQGKGRRQFDQELAADITAIGVDLVVLAGWDHLLSEAFVTHHPVINLHPARPGTFPGLGAIERAYAAWQDGSISAGGVMVHFVPDEGIDNGPVIVSEDIAFESNETLAAYTTRVHQVEHRLLVEAIAKVLELAEQQAFR